MNSPKFGKGRTETMMRVQVRDFKRERVLEEATKLFYERGFQGSSIDAIAERLSVTKPFIYTYFENKQALLVALYERAVGDLNAGVDKIFSVDHAPEKQLELLVKFYVRQNIESRELTAIFLNEERNLSPDKGPRRISQDDSRITVLVVPTNEELAIARDCVDALAGL